MFRKIALLFFAMLLWFMSVQEVHAEEKETLVFVYVNEQGVPTENVKKLDLLLHHFPVDVTIVNIENVIEKDMKNADYVVFYGEAEKPLDKSVIQTLQTLSTPIVFIGENVDQIEAMEIGQSVLLQSVSFTEKGPKFPVQGKISANPIFPNEMQKILLYGFYGKKVFPIMVKDEQRYFLPVTDLNDLLLKHVAERLHDIIANDHPAVHEAYIRLENIHPMTEPEKVQEVIELLNVREIPYVLSVKPVYTNPDTKDRVEWKDATELLKILRDAQKKNGTIIVNGYSNDQYAGYEFWDAMLDQPMIQMEDTGLRTSFKQKEQFQNPIQYDEYLSLLEEKEKNYAAARMDRAVTELVKQGLHPAAFAPPFHVMGEASYQVLASHFSSFFGQIQLSNETMHSLYAAPYVTTASFLQGTTNFPETVGDISDLSAEAHQRAIEKLAEAQLVRDGMIGLSYQAYLGAGNLASWLDKLEQMPQVTWFNLTETEQHVQASKIAIQTGDNEPIKVVNTLTKSDQIKEWINQFTFLEKILWGVTLLVFIFVTLFLFFAFYLRMQLKKRLFGERR